MNYLVSQRLNAEQNFIASYCVNSKPKFQVRLYKVWSIKGQEQLISGKAKNEFRIMVAWYLDEQN